MNSGHVKSALREVLATEPVAFCEICGARIAWAESEEDRVCSACWDELTPEERAPYELPREVIGAGKLRDKEEGGKKFTVFEPDESGPDDRTWTEKIRDGVKDAIENGTTGEDWSMLADDFGGDADTTRSTYDDIRREVIRQGQPDPGPYVLPQEMDD
jgi:hypothetical protein